MIGPLCGFLRVLAAICASQEKIVNDSHGKNRMDRTQGKRVWSKSKSGQSEDGDFAKRSQVCREIGEQCKCKQKRGIEMENGICKRLVPITLRMGSPAFQQAPPRQNVRLLSAFCSHKKYIFYELAGRADRRLLRIDREFE